MIGRLCGEVLEEAADGTVLLDVRDVTYELLTPLGTLQRACAMENKRVCLYVFTYVRPEQLVLFGFATPTEKNVFRVLIGLSNVGPKMALAVLSVLPPVDLAQAVADKDLARLVTIPGVGKKTAERLLLELRDKLPTMAAPGQAAPSTRKEESLLSALMHLGYRSSEATRAVAALRGEQFAGKSTDALLREALAFLSMCMR